MAKKKKNSRDEFDGMLMSELDNNRKHFLLESMKDIQTIVTCTGYDDFIKSRIHINQIYQVSNGTVDLIQ